MALLFGHPGLSQAGEIGGFVQGTDIGHPEKIAGGRLQAGDARITIVAVQPAGFGKLGGGAFAVAFEGVGGGEPGVRLGM